MTDDRYLIVNADDFGLSDDVNEGVVEVHRCGILTSASLMVRRPAADAAVELARQHPRLGVGLHVDLGEWAYEDGAWIRSHEFVPPDDSRAVSDEVTRQLRRFRQLLGRDPTHLDSHQHVHMEEPSRSILTELARRLEIPLRGCTSGVRHCGAFYGQGGKGEPLPEGIGVDNLLGILETLPAGVTELACHPGGGNDMDLVYGAERGREVRTLCDPRVREAIESRGILRCSFADVRAWPGKDALDSTASEADDERPTSGR